MSDTRQAFVTELERLNVVLDDVERMIGQMRDRQADLLEALSTGGALRDVVSAEIPPLIVQLLTSSADVLHRDGNRVRRTEAQLLHEEGMTMEEIAEVFGVTRQRVSALLRGS